MASSRSSGGDLNAMASALTKAGYEVFAIDTSNSQVELSACAGPTRKWILSPVAKFASVCGGWSSSGVHNTTNASADVGASVEETEEAPAANNSTA